MEPERDDSAPHRKVEVGGLFDRPIAMSFGATQGAESIHYRASERFKLETISLPPDLAGARIPGVGRELSERLAQLSNVAVWAAQVRAAPTSPNRPMAPAWCSRN